jgi:hypothetical protein
MKRKVGISLMFAAALPLIATSIAWACGVLATAKADKKVAAPGESVTVTGKNYSTSATASAVTVRLAKRSGDVLSTTAPNANGAISTTFAMPSNLSPGWYVLQVLQFNANGTPKSGTPGRTTIRIQGSAAAAATPWTGSTPSGPASFASDVGGGSLLPMLGAITLSLTMLAGGWTLVARRGRPASSASLAI